jgi:pimeloyl-ACP methyl ester carboxylesterase
MPPPLWMVRTAFRTVGNVAPDVAARWAEAIFCRPPRHEARAPDDAFLATGRRLSIAWEEGTLAAWTWGTGPTVLLVHGWGSRAGRFCLLGPALVAAGFRVVAHDGPGHGESPGRRASLPQFADAVRAVADELGPVSGVVGHSLGGAAVALAIRQGLSPESAVLLAAPADVEIFSHRFARRLAIPPAARLAMQRNLEDRFGLRWTEINVARLAAGMRVPGLVIHDASDADVPVADGQAIAGAWPGAELVTTTGLGHRGVLWDGDVIRRVVAFIGMQRPACAYPEDKTAG